MSIREKLNNNPVMAASVGGGTLLVALICVIFGLHTTRATDPTKAYYSDDDGASYFADDVDQIAPFDHNGKPAVRCYVFVANGTKWVGYLERYTPAAARKLDAQVGQVPGPDTFVPLSSDFDVKKPGTGDKAWVKRSDPKSIPILAVTLPSGVPSDANVAQYLP